MVTATSQIARVAIPVPLRKTFDYLIPPQVALPVPGARVRVPFGPKRSIVGVVLSVSEESATPQGRLKPITQILDNEPLLPASLLALLEWSSDYYHYPIGEVVAAALPAALRQGNPAVASGERIWKLTDVGFGLTPKDFGRAKTQERVWAALKAQSDGMPETALSEITPRWRTIVRAFASNEWANYTERDCLPSSVGIGNASSPVLTEAQALAVEALGAARGYAPFLLHGVTGSGKTEVYLRAIERVLAQGMQTLVLVPEISLTPQLAARFRSRFSVPLAVLHSRMSDQERLCAWLMARAGTARIVLGTRSAVYTPMSRLGIIIVDEEHDASLKQQEGFRYSARDVAIMRASREGVPIVLGSATPSLESLQRVRAGAYRYLGLPKRAAGAELPLVQLLDVRKLPLHEGITPPLRAALSETLARGEQSLLFLNRRGFAPVWMCYDCGWVAPCRRCDARLTFHKARAGLHCHHCGAEAEVPRTCPDCKGASLHPLGAGTERIETVLRDWFPEARVMRIDRDSMRAKGALEQTLQRVRDGGVDILIGTQMLSKGHDFPNVTLVGVINADQGLYSSDFRAAERLVQQIMQVSGRAGRAAKAGRVLIQTYHPTHPALAALTSHDYDGFADYALQERRDAGYPPFAHLALLRADALSAAVALAFLRQARAIAQQCQPSTGVQLMDPVPSPMERRAGRYRAQLLVQATQRAPLHGLLQAWIDRLGELKETRRVRWSIDVDPIDLY